MSEPDAVFVDSGSFSVDSLRARQKLARFQLANSGLWLVKLVQAAVALQAPGVEIRFARSEVSVQFEPEAALSASELLASVMDGSMPREAGLLHLLTGIRSSAGETTETVSWSVGGQEVTLDASGSHVAESTRPGFWLRATRPARRRTLSETLVTPVSHWLQNTADEYEAVCSRCWPCPIPVLLDGKPLERGSVSLLQKEVAKTPMGVLAQYERSRQSVLFACLSAEELPSLPDRPPLPTRLPEGPPLRKPVPRGETFLLRRQAESEVGGCVALWSWDGCSSAMVFVCDGAVVSTHTLPWNPPRRKFLGIPGARNHFGVRFLFPVSSEELDLSHFEVRNREQLVSELLEYGVPVALSGIERVLAELPSFYYLPLKPRWVKAGAAWGAAQVVGTVAVAGPGILPVIAGGVAVLAGMNIAHYRTDIRTGLKALRDSIR